MSICELDLFPAELVYHLLNYFSSHEILRTFSDVSPYLDAILLAYPNYRVNFKSILRTDFDLVCRRISPNQVISLTLSDDKDTPGQIRLFLSRFGIEEFTRLRSLTLIDVGADFWEPIISQLVQLPSLRSFSFVTPTKNDSWRCEISGYELDKLNVRLLNSYAPMLSQLNRLQLVYGDYFPAARFPHLRHLTLCRCSLETLKHICSAAPQLKSLDIQLRYHWVEKKFIFPFSNLNWLVLKLSDRNVSMSDMEQLFSNLPYLKHLELHANGQADLADGQRWQTLVGDLVAFNFMFELGSVPELQVLDSFRSPFWLEEKRWFVACDKQKLFSVPFFATTTADKDFRPPAYSTASDNSIFYKQITELSVRKLPTDTDHRFPHVETLNLGGPIPLSTLEKIVDLSRVQHLMFPSWMGNSLIESLQNQMTNLQEISIHIDVREFLEKTRCRPMEQIRMLEIESYLDDDNDGYSIEKLCYIFPCVQRLCVKHMCSISQISEFIDRFKNLRNASFLCIPSSFIGDAKWREHLLSTLNAFTI